MPTGLPAVSRLPVHIDALVLIPSTGFKENFLRFSADFFTAEDTEITEGRKAHPQIAQIYRRFRAVAARFVSGTAETRKGNEMA